MDLIESLTLAGVVLTTLLVLVALGTLLWRSGQSEARRVAGRQEIMGSLDTINGHLETLNGSVADVTKLAHDNTERIATIEGAHQRSS